MIQIASHQLLRMCYVAFMLGAVLIGSPALGQNVVVAYVPNWVELRAFASAIDYSRVTHLNLAFENPYNDTGDLTFEPASDAVIAMAHSHHVKILVSLGGGSASEDKLQRDRYFDLISDAKRPGFVSRLVKYLDAHNLDGIDVDIEGPAINKDYGAFMRDLSSALKPKGKLLTTALSQGYGGAQVPASIFDQVDFVNIMAYDGAGPWDPKSPGQHSSFEYAKGNVAYWLSRGLPKGKAVLGVPFYGYGFGKAFRKDDYAYSELVATYSGAEKLDQVGDTIWYNGLGTIKAKAKYVVEQGLAGVMIWSLDYDVKGEKSLLKAIYEALNPPDHAATATRKQSP